MDSKNKSRIRVAIITDRNDLAIPLSESLIQNECSVDLITSNLWLSEKSIIRKNKYLSLVNASDLKEGKTYRYTILIKLFQGIKKNKEKKDDEKLINQSLDIASKFSSKLLLIFPINQTKEVKKETNSIKEIYLKKGNMPTAVLYIGDLAGSLMDANRTDIFSLLIKEAVVRKVVRLPQDSTYFYPLEINKAASEIVRNLFSFGVYGKEAAIQLQRISPEKLAYIIKIKIPSIQIKKGRLEKITQNKSIDEIIIIPGNVEEIINQSVAKFQRSNDSLAKKEYLIRFLLLVFLAILFPVLTFILSTTFLVLANNQIRKGNIDIARESYKISQVSAKLLYNYLNTAQKIPGGKMVLFPGAKIASNLEKNALVGSLTVVVADTYSDLIENVFSEEKYDPSFYSERMALDIDSIFKKTGFLIGETDSLGGFTGELFVNAVYDSSYLRERKKLIPLKNFVEQWGEAMGAREKKTYLLLFQNNRELRPTGGVIKSIALIEFEGGRLINYEVHNASFADDQIKGYVEPPLPLKEYLSLERWMLKDSNWDADFPSSAVQAEWFIDKQIDKAVNGVIAVDIEFVKQAIKLIGPVEIETSENKIDQNNIYEVLAEREEGAYTELLQKLIQEIIKSKTKEKMKLTLELIKSLSAKHAQIFLHHNESQAAIIDLDWGGSIKQNECAGNCLYDWIGLIEADFESDVSSISIEKKAEITISLEEGVVKKTLAFLARDTRSRNEGDKKYRAYLRVLVPGENGFSPAIIRSKDGEEEILPEIVEIKGTVEAGMYFELDPGETKIFILSWEGKSGINQEKEGYYEFLWRKQAGTEGFPIDVSINSPIVITKTEVDGEALTTQVPFKYNTNLSRDVVSRIYW